MIKKVKELIEELQKYDPEANILATWEGIEEKIEVYQAADGTILIDADNCHYKERYMSGKIKIAPIEHGDNDNEETI